MCRVCVGAAARPPPPESCLSTLSRASRKRSRRRLGGCSLLGRRGHLSRKAKTQKVRPSRNFMPHAARRSQLTAISRSLGALLELAQDMTPGSGGGCACRRSQFQHSSHLHVGRIPAMAAVTTAHACLPQEGSYTCCRAECWGVGVRGEAGEDAAEQEAGMGHGPVTAYPEVVHAEERGPPSPHGQGRHKRKLLAGFNSSSHLQ